MENAAKLFLEKTATSKESNQVARLKFPPHKPHVESSFYEYFVLRGIRVDRIQPGSSIFCSFKVPPRLTDKNGNLGIAAITTLIDEIGAAVIHKAGQPMDVSVDMSISYISPAKISTGYLGGGCEPLNIFVMKGAFRNVLCRQHGFTNVCRLWIYVIGSEKLDIASSGLAPPVTDELEIISRCLGKRGGYSGTIVLIRNKTTGEVVAEGRHSLFSKPTSKI